MITEDAIRQNVYQHILKAANRRLEQAIPGSSDSPEILRSFVRGRIEAILHWITVVLDRQRFARAG